jgi:hypothetical protein
MNTNHSNINFEKEILNLKKWLANNVQGTCGYSKQIVFDRLMQLLVAISLPVYAKSIKKSSQNSSYALPITESMLELEIANLELGTGKLTITIKIFLKEIINFLIHWVVCLISIIFTEKSADYVNKVVLVYIGDDAIFSDGNDGKFVKYCLMGKIEPLKTKNKLYIECRTKNRPNNHHNFYYCDRPLLSAIRNLNLGIAFRLRLCINHTLLLVVFLTTIIRVPQLSLLGKEIAYSSIVKDLDKAKKIESIILTCSNYLEQKIWSRELINVRVHMVWNAQAWKPTVYKVDKLESHIPNLPWIRADIHWIWTNKFADYLCSLGLKAKFQVVGSIVWYMPKLKKQNDSSIQIMIFDVSPFSDDVALEYGHITNYNNPHNLFAFINDVLCVVKNIEKILNISIKILLKQKREYKPVYDKDYYVYLENLSASGQIILENCSKNIYSLISSSQIVIAYPFTSPAYIADEVKIPSIYYDPTGAICGSDFRDQKSLITFVDSRKLLQKSIMEKL